MFPLELARSLSDNKMAAGNWEDIGYVNQCSERSHCYHGFIRKDGFINRSIEDTFAPLVAGYPLEVDGVRPDIRQIAATAMQPERFVKTMTPQMHRARILGLRNLVRDGDPSLFKCLEDCLQMLPKGGSLEHVDQI